MIENSYSIFASNETSTFAIFIVTAGAVLLRYKKLEGEELWRSIVVIDDKSRFVDPLELRRRAAKDVSEAGRKPPGILPFPRIVNTSSFW